MEEVLHANVFFFVTSIAVIIFTIVLTLVLYNVLKIIKAVRRIVDKVEMGSDTIINDISEFRSYVTETSIISKIVGLVFGGARGGPSDDAPARPRSRPSRPDRPSRTRKLADAIQGRRGTKTSLPISDEDDE